MPFGKGYCSRYSVKYAIRSLALIVISCSLPSSFVIMRVRPLSTPALMSKTRFCSERLICASFATGLRVMKLDSGTRPSDVRTFSESKVLRKRSLSGRRTRISISSSLVGTRIVSKRIPRVTSCTIAPTVATSAPKRPAFSTSTSICQSIPGRGRLSSICVSPSVVSKSSRMRAVLSSSTSQSSPLSLRWTGLPLPGPRLSSKISVSKP